MSLILERTSIAPTNATEQLGLNLGLFQALNQSGIRYCDWKSTHELEKGLGGGTDLDLLVDRAEAKDFRQVLLNCDFKPFVSAPQRQYPAIEDYLGFDRQTGALIHLHVHYRLVLGEQYTKNFWIPLERAFLDNTRLKNGVRVPIPELEIIVLVLRALLKYRDRDGAHDVLKRGGRSGLSASILREFDYLLAQTSLERIASTVTRYADFISPAIILGFLTTIQQAPRDAATLLHLRRLARRALVPYRRFGFVQARYEYYRAVLRQEMPIGFLRRYLLADRHKRAATGGLGIALIGMDGAGKSTAVKQISRWLSWRVNTYVFYMGTTHPSLRTQIVRSVSNVGNSIQAGLGRVLGKTHGLTRATSALDQFLTAWRFLAEGRDRHDRYLAGQRKIAQGGVVIYDRYPLSAISIDGRAMDGPRIAAMGPIADHGLLARLAAAEQDLYRQIRPPERIVVLRVSPEVSQARKPEHRRERIDAKSQALSEFVRDDLDVTEVDAEQPLDQVLLQIKTAIWSWL